MQSNGYLGRGLNFPIQLVNGSAVLSTHEPLIESSMKTILSWPIFQRFFNPYFGSRLWQLIGEPNDQVLKALVKRFILDALSYWEQRINVLEVSVINREADKIIVNISYKILATSALREMEYTFYLNSYEY